jgi:hypothetical protein
MQKEKRCFEAIPNRYGMHTGMNLNGCRCGNSKAARLPKLRGSSHCRFRHLTISERGGGAGRSYDFQVPGVRLCNAQITLTCLTIVKKMVLLFIDHSTDLWNLGREGSRDLRSCSIQKGGCHEKNVGGPCRCCHPGHFGRAAGPCPARPRRGCGRWNHRWRYRWRRDCGHDPVPIRICPRLLRARLWSGLCCWPRLLAGPTLLGWLCLADSPRLGLSVIPAHLH